MSGFFELVSNRQSCRKYDPDRRPEKEALLACIAAAHLAPSACNSQPWHFTVVNDPALSPKTAKCTQNMGINKFTDDCPAFIVISETKATLSERIGSVFGSQHYAQIDIGIATAHLCYAAQEQGLSTCILGSFDEKMVADMLNIPGERVRLILAIGYAKDDQLRNKVRKPIEEIMDYIG